MHYYKRNIGDYAKKAARLSMLQHGAYTLLLDACYDRERFPTEGEAIEWAWASTPDEIQAVKFVLSKFFRLQDDGTYVQDRVAEELEHYAVLGVMNRITAIVRELRRKKGDEDTVQKLEALKAEIKNEPFKKSHAAWSALVDNTRGVHDASPNHKPQTINHKPQTTNQEPNINISAKADMAAKKKKQPAVIPDWIPRDAWLGFVEMRKAKKKPLTERAIHSIEKKLIEFMNRGYDIAAILDQSTINGWTDVYAPKDNTGAYYANNQLLTPAQQRTAESQRIDELLRSGAAGILRHSNKDIRQTQDCAPVPVSARLSDCGIGDRGSEIVGEYVSSGAD